MFCEWFSQDLTSGIQISTSPDGIGAVVYVSKGRLNGTSGWTVDADADSSDVQRSYTDFLLYRRFDGVATVFAISGPHWAWLLAFSVLPAVRIGISRRKRSAPAGLCRHCGYDLRASKDRCPECGETMQPSTADAKG